MNLNSKLPAIGFVNDNVIRFGFKFCIVLYSIYFGGEQNWIEFDLLSDRMTEI